MRAASGLLLIAALIACSRTQEATSTPTPINSVDVQLTPLPQYIGRGIRCIPPGTVIALMHPLPPLTYAADDLGKVGVPPLSEDEQRTLRRIKHYVNSKTLRVAWVVSRNPGKEFIVYDADRGPCVLANIPYKVLNGGCNEYYGSGELPFATEPAPDCNGYTRPPWMTPSPK